MDIIKNILNKVKNNRKIVMLICSIALVITILINSTYSLLVNTDETTAMNYTTGTLEITSNATNNSVTLTNSLPMNDEDGMNSTPFTFQITNVGNLTFKFNVKLLATISQNLIDAQYIKISVNDGDPVTLDSLTDGIILEDIVLNSGKSIDVTLRVWLDINTPNTQIGKVFNAKIVTEGQAIYNPSFSTLTSLGLEDDVKTDTPDFANTSCSSGCGEATVGIYETEDDLGTSYYFRGDVTNNYVMFGKDAEGNDMYWRIIRINGDGTVRMIYMGTDITATSLTPVGTSTFNTNNDDNTYVGYMYGATGQSTYALTHTNTTNSAIKTFLEGTEANNYEDGWYYQNIVATGYNDYVADAIYCNDRSLSSGDGTGVTVTYYGAFERLSTNKTPTLKCDLADYTNDSFTVKNELGNGLLKYPVGLITADEVAMAGGKYNSTNSSFYLYSSDSYWTMSAFSFDGVRAREFYLSGGNLYRDIVLDYYGVLPAISLKSDVLQFGTGTSNDPFRQESEYLTQSSSEQVLVNLGLTVTEGTPNFANTSCSSGCGEATVGIYAAEDDLGTSYYFRGDVTNNYVMFGKNSSGKDMYWRIVRINGNGTIRMIYMGTDINATSLTPVGTSAFNTNWDNNTYVGYMYGATGQSTYALTHTNTTNSTIKTFLEGTGNNDGWYYENIVATGYHDYVADAIYCNDRSLSTGTGAGTADTEYGAIERLGTEAAHFIPTFKCDLADYTNDSFTVNNELGNGLLEYPVGLITADEVAMAGGKYNSTDSNSSFYLYSSNSYWTMSPYFVYLGVDGAREFNLSNGSLNGSGVDDSSSGVLPVISLNADSLQYGTGTSDDPFRLVSEYEPTLTSEQVLANLGLSVSSGTPNFSNTSCSSGCGESTVGIYAAEDDLGTSYYFRGDVTNNYVKFGKNASNQDMYWRIVRINGDGTVRMIYMGTNVNATELTPVGESEFNTKYNDNTYAGYMFGATGQSTYALTHTNTTNSTIKTYLEGTGNNDGWYYENIVSTGYHDYVADAIYCNDRSLSSGTGTGTTETYYGAVGRLDATTPSPTLKCDLADYTNDSFTVNTNLGNGLLEYPVGLITADEVAMAGGKLGTNNSSFYLYSGSYYWTMSPDIGFSTNVFTVDSGNLAAWCLDFIYSILPVISLKADAIIDGTGTTGDPFVVE